MAAKEWQNIRKQNEVDIDKVIIQYLNMPLNLQGVFCPMMPQSQTSTDGNSSPTIAISNTISTTQLPENNIEEIRSNTIAQKKAIESQTQKINKLKRNAMYQFKYRDKKRKTLEEQNEVVRYDQLGRPLLLIQHPDLLYNIHDSVEYRAADIRRRKEAIKVRIVNHLCQNLEENYNIYMCRSSLNNYLLSQRSNSITAKAHHHPAWVVVAGVSYDETKEHQDKHYCLASVKGAKQFAKTFANMSIIISQDDKSKIGLGVPAVGKTFCTLQSIAKPPDKSNDNLCSGQLAIFVRLQWSLGTSSATHIEDLSFLVSNVQYTEALTINSSAKPI
ncbi:5897_t:CDS:2 [Scutellospora calospora]|uniref:5897_t:CDS:1 n=1 Tax=Scutellospora calospora TaxID=85575 RepID=A0ACA9L4C3_9GLOM|nr:5897_t:CDS:2 [Scutellospora calospora]